MKKILLIQAIYYKNISEMLLEGAKKELKKNKIAYDVVNVLGALEIPTVISLAQASKKKYDGYIALGCVIKGETSHYDIVCNESARSLSYLSCKMNIAIANAILTVDNESQALERANPNKKNKGGFAVKACLQLINLKNNFFNL